MRRKLLQTALSLLLLLGVTPALADGPADPAEKPAHCPARGDKPKLFALGSSTMGSVLGPILKSELAKQGVTVRRWGKASSGLARPDFHDWPRLAPGLVAKHRPDVVVINLGGNDFQNLWNKGRWVDLTSPKWAKIYAERVDEMLEVFGGKAGERLVIWMGPFAFEGTRAQKYAPVVNGIMKERVEAYAAAGGKAVFIDLYSATSTDAGRALERLALDESEGKKVDIRGHDGIHLTADAVRALMAQPVIDVVQGCWGPAAVALDSDGAGDADGDDDDDDTDEGS